VSAGRPSHLISPEEVDAWLADSTVRAVTYHRTTVLGARSILERGVDIARSRVGAYGQGFYTASAPIDDDLYDLTLAVAVRLLHPLRGSPEEVEAHVDRLILERYGALRPITPEVAAAVRRDFIRLGYDGLVIRDVDGGGLDYVVAFFGASVRAVQT
jgi:hypothetical protein